MALRVLPGSFVDKHTVLMHVDKLDDMDLESLRAAFTIGVRRSFDQDPRFGVSVLSEIASRALSPAVNAPGTAIDVIGKGVRILSLWDRRMELEEEVLPRCSQIFVPGLSLSDLFDDFFGPMSRDGAGMVEVGIRMQKSLASLARNRDAAFAPAAVRHSALALKRAEIALPVDEDLQQLRQLALRVRAVTSG